MEAYIIDAARTAGGKLSGGVASARVSGGGLRCGSR